MSAAEVVEHYVFALDAEVVEHSGDGFGHRSGAAHIVFDVLGGGMVLEVGVVHHVVFPVQVEYCVALQYSFFLSDIVCAELASVFQHTIEYAPIGSRQW